MVLPSRKKLSTILLDRAFSRVKNGVMQKLNGQSVCLTSDGWTNIKGCAVVNYLVSFQGQSYFLEAASTGKQQHSSAWLAKDILRIIQTYSSLDISGVVTDNTSANKGAWKILLEKTSGKFFYGQDFCERIFLHSA